jgi:RHS repeat-associated protein
MSGFRHFSCSEHTGHRFGFNGHELDSEVKTNGNHTAFGGNGYDPRLGRRWNIDPLGYKYRYLSPYTFAGNSPVIFKDTEGDDFYANSKKARRQVMKILNLTFGKGEHGFEFNEAGKLVHSGDGYVGTWDQQLVYDHFKEKIVEKQDVNVVFEGFGKRDFTDLYGIQRPLLENPTGGFSNIVNGVGGLAYTSQKVIGGRWHAKIAIGPRIRNVIYSEEGVLSNRATAFWHEVGHPLAQTLIGFDESLSGKTREARLSVGFENKVRDIFGMERRSGDGHGVGYRNDITGEDDNVPGTEGSDPSFDIHDRRPTLPEEPGGGEGADHG